MPGSLSCCCDPVSTCGNGNTTEGPFSGTLNAGSVETHAIIDPPRTVWNSTVRFGPSFSIPVGSSFLAFSTQLDIADKFEARFTRHVQGFYLLTMYRNSVPFGANNGIFNLIGNLFRFAVAPIPAGTGSLYRLNMVFSWDNGTSNVAMQGLVLFPLTTDWCINSQLWMSSSTPVSNQFQDFKTWVL